MALLCWLLILMIQGSDDNSSMKRKRESNQEIIKHENNSDVVDICGILIKKNIQRIQQQTENHRISPTVADALYHADTINKVEAHFYSGWYHATSTIHSSYFHSLPTELIVHQTHATLVEKTEDKWKLVANTPPSYHYHPVTQRLSIELNPAVDQLNIAFHNNFTPGARHLHWWYEEDTIIPLRLQDLTLSYRHPLETIDLREITRVNALVIQAPNHSTSAVTMMVPQTMKTLEVKDEFTFQPATFGISIVGTEVVETVTIRCATVSTLELQRANPRTLVFDHVHLVRMIQWPMLSVHRISLAWGSWPDQGLDLSAMPAVVLLEFAHLENQSPTTLARFIFPASVGTLSLGPGAYRLAAYLPPASLAGANRVMEIHLDVTVTMSERSNFRDDCIPNLCRAILPLDTLPEFLDQCTRRIGSLVTESRWRSHSLTKYAIINVPDLKDYLTNASYDYAHTESSQENEDRYNNAE